MAVFRECSTSRFIADAVLKWSTPPICKVTTLREGNRYRRLCFRLKNVFRAQSACSPEEWSVETGSYTNCVRNVIL